MKIKSLLLIPFLLSSCASSTEETKTSNPFKETSDSKVVYDEVPSTTETPYEQLKPQAESDLIYYDRSYIGVNVGPIPTVGTVIVPDQEHCPFTPAFREELSEMVDSSATSKNPSRLIRSESFEGLVNLFEDDFMTEYYLSYPSMEERNLHLEIKHAATKKYLSQFFKHTLYENDENEQKSYYVFAEGLANFCHDARHPKRPSDYYTEEYKKDLIETLEKDEIETYFGLFDKYGTEYIEALTFAPSQMIFMGFSSKAGLADISCTQYDQDAIINAVNGMLEEEPLLNLDDFWINGDERSYFSGSFDNMGARLITYRTRSFYNYLPEGYSDFRVKINEAYKQYRQAKFEEFKESNKDLYLGEEKTTIKDNYRIVGEGLSSKASVEIKKNGQFLDGFHVKDVESMYNPQELSNKGYTKVYFRPNVKFSEEHDDLDITLQIMAGGKKIKALDSVKLAKDETSLTSAWYQLEIKDLLEVSDEVTIVITSGNNKSTITKCDFEIVYTK